MGQLLYILGLTAPFAYASAVYGLFAFLERNASPAARRTLSDWIKGNPYYTHSCRRRDESRTRSIALINDLSPSRKHFQHIFPHLRISNSIRCLLPKPAHAFSFV